MGNLVPLMLEGNSGIPTACRTGLHVPSVSHTAASCLVGGKSIQGWLEEEVRSEGSGKSEQTE